MSWFDASGFANIAKTALREAQKTIDKALDIKEDETASAPCKAPIDTNSDDFFDTWGLSQPGSSAKEHPKNEQNAKALKLQSSLWGSFSGSFFEGTKEEAKSPSIDSLDDSVDTSREHFTRSKLVVHNESNEYEEESEILKNNESEVKMLQKDPNTSSLNRLSIVSSNSCKNSESVELISTSPDSEIQSIEQEKSSSSAIDDEKQTSELASESVEVLGDSLTTPSVEVITFDSSSSESKEFTSPFDSPLVEELAVPSFKSSPDSVEVIPEEQEESVAEDTMSYTSISESTSATVLDHPFVHLKPQMMLKDTYNMAEPVLVSFLSQTVTVI